MTRTSAARLIHTYINGWRQNDVEKIIQPLSKNCIIIESHGPVYRGESDVRHWVNNWVKKGYKVDKWEIISLEVFKDKGVFEWIFEFSSNEKPKRTIEGITIFRCQGNRIVFLREYRTTGPVYDWRQKTNIPHH